MVKKLILCEGGDDIAFLSRYLNEFLCIDRKTYEIRKMGNKSNFFKKDSYSTIIQQVKANLYDKVLFVLDSDFEEKDSVHGGYKNTEDKIKEIIKDIKIEAVSQYFISCDPNTKNGNLEHLLLSTCEESKKKCIESFIKCIGLMDIETSNKKIVLTTYKEIFNNHPYNFEHKNFDELKIKINDLFKEIN